MKVIVGKHCMYKGQYLKKQQMQELLDKGLYREVEIPDELFDGIAYDQKLLVELGHLKDYEYILYIV